MQVEVEVDECCSVRFRFVSGILEVESVVDQAHRCSKEQWLKLIEAIRDKTYFNLDYYEGNGDAGIKCDGQKLIFYTWSYGDTGDFSMNVNVPLNEDITQVLLTVIEHPLLNREWKRKIA